MRKLAALLLLVLVGVAGPVSCAPGQSPPAPSASARQVEIDLEHILNGEINRRGDLVGLHHAPSAPETMRADGALCKVEFVYTSAGGNADVRTARAILRHPETDRIVREKFSTLFPSNWSRETIEQAIREAYEDARSRDRIEENGRWEGRTAKGVRIGGYESRDGRGIATAYPIYTPPRQRSRR